MNYIYISKRYDEMMKMKYSELREMKRKMDETKDWDNPDYVPLCDALSMKSEMIHG